jgi:hypothetical protein
MQDALPIVEVLLSKWDVEAVGVAGCLNVSGGGTFS